MKILKKGTVPQPKLRQFRGTCPNCGCQVECNENEAQVTAERRMNGRQLWTINCPFKLLSYTCGSVIPLEEYVTRAESMPDNIFAQAEKNLRGIPPEYPVNYGKEVPVEQPKSDMAKAFEDFFKPSPGEKGWWEKDYPAPKKTPKPMNELSCLADEIIYGPIDHPGNH